MEHSTPLVGSMASPQALLQQLTQQDELLYAEGLGQILGLSAVTVEADASRRPDRLPPPVQIPGGRRCWLRSTVFAWLKSHEVGSTAPAAVLAAPTKRGRGRPRAGVQS